MLGNFLRTAARTFRFSAAVPCAATIANAIRACVLSGIGYFRSDGKANVVDFMRLRDDALILAKTRPL